MHDWDKGNPDGLGPTNGEMMRTAMNNLGSAAAQRIFDEEIVPIRAREAEAERKRVAAERERKMAQLRDFQQRVAALKHELGVYTCTVCGELIEYNQTCHGPPP